MSNVIQTYILQVIVCDIYNIPYVLLLKGFSSVLGSQSVTIPPILTLGELLLCWVFN